MMLISAKFVPKKLEILLTLNYTNLIFLRLSTGYFFLQRQIIVRSWTKRISTFLLIY
jgi:hypothetical protein